MSEQTEPTPASNGGNRRSEVESNDATARQVLLEEARTTTSEQLGQVNKLDAAAVRTVRITFLLLGLLVGGSRIPPFPDLGVFGVLGTWTLLGSLFAGLFVYGTSQLFVGSSLDELPIDCSEGTDVGLAQAELVEEYEDGLQMNRRVLYLNGFVLAIARTFLALSVTFIVSGFGDHVVG